MPNARSVSKEKAAPSPQLRAVQRKAAAPKTTPAPFLTGTQERIADVIGELIVSGGKRHLLEALVRIGAEHHALRSFQGSDHRDTVKRWTEEHSRQWYDDLAFARANSAALPEEIRPKSADVAEIIRARRREEVREELDKFAREAGAEEILLMWHVMTNWQSRRMATTDGYGEIYIASAFALEIDGNRNYIRVPWHLVEDVERYVQALLKANPVKGEA